MAWPLLLEHGYLGASIDDGRVVSYLNEAPLGCELEIFGAPSADGDGYVFRTVRREDGKVNVLAKITSTKI